MVQQEAKAKFTIAICGAGPGGLALAATIAKFNDPAAPVAIDLYEAQNEIGTVGAGISVWPRTRRLLDAMGLLQPLDSALRASQNANTMEPYIMFRKSDEEAGYEFFRLRPPPFVALHRSALITTLQSRLPPPSLCRIHTSTRVISYTEDPSGTGVTLRFEKGNTARADAVIGADGVRSAVRTNMFTKHHPNASGATWSGTIAYRALVPREKLNCIYGAPHPAGSTFTLYCGYGKHIVTYPIAPGSMVNLVVFVTEAEFGTPYSYQGDSDSRKWVHDETTDNVAALFAGWEPEVMAIVQAPEKYSAWAIHVVMDAPACAMGRAAIIGDALHAMETHLGAGAGQAMEDAFILGRLLTHPLVTRENLPDVLSAYQAARLKPSTSYVRAARKLGLSYEFLGGHSIQGRVLFRESLDGESIKEMGNDWTTRWGQFVIEHWKVQWTGTPSEWWDTAQRELLNALFGGQSAREEFEL